MTRKNLKTLTLFLLISIFIFAITGCSSNSEDPLSSSKSYNVNFTVADQNEEAVDAADLTLAGETKKTNADGVVSFRKADGRYDYEVNAPGYKHFSSSIVVNGADTLEELKLQLLSSGGDEPGEEDEADITPPSLDKLFGWIDGKFYGEAYGIDIGEIIELIDQDPNYNYFILYFSEVVKLKEDAEFIPAEDFVVQLISVDPNEELVIDEALLSTSFLVLKIDENHTLDSYEGLVKVIVTDSGRQKIFDEADNMLAEDPAYLELEIKK